MTAFTEEAILLLRKADQPFAAQVRYEHLPLEGMSLERAESMIRDARTWAGSLMR